MKLRFKLFIGLLILSALGCAGTAKFTSGVEMNALFSDNMVLQRGIEVPIWGMADPSATVTVKFMEQELSAVADANGDWIVKLAPLEAGGPYELTVSGSEIALFSNVMVGDVWIGSGQSNMEMPLADWGKVNDYQNEIDNANYPDIRLFTVEHTTSHQPLSEVNSDGWQVCSPATISNFSSTEYFFGREIHKNQNVPIGLIHSSWGGTIVEAWTSGESLKKREDFAEAVALLEGDTTDTKAAHAKYLADVEAWNQTINDLDSEITASGENWFDTNFEGVGLESMTLPTVWEKSGLPGFDGIVWFRKEIEIPENWVGLDLVLSLGPIDDRDITWFNGEQVGATDVWDAPRVYRIAPELVKAGKNVITIRVLDTGGGGGIYGEPEEMEIAANSEKGISLAGDWQYTVGTSVGDLPPYPVAPNSPNRPMVLYNGMIAPLLPYAIRGAIWYQGESNVGRAQQYSTLFPELISDWRDKWGQGDFPFYFVQLANFLELQTDPVEDDWAELRDAQKVALNLSNTGMAVAIDIGDADDIHPKEKQEVGRRLSLIAGNNVYGEDIVYSGPLYRSHKIEAGKIQISFDHAEGMNSGKDTELKGFAIAGEDGIFYWADAVIEGETIVVSSVDVPEPKTVRYAWAANPICNLYNGAGLPASPFTTN